MKVLIFEPHFNGHRSIYVRHIIDACRGLAIELTLATTVGVLDQEEYQKSLAPLADEFKLDASIAPATGSHTSIARHGAAQLRKAIRRSGAQHAYLPYGDGVSQFVCLGALLGQRRLPCEIEVILHHSQHSYPQSRVRKRLRLQVERAAWRASPFERVHHVDFLEYRGWSERGIAAGMCVLLPDPVECPPPMEKRVAREKLGLTTDGLWMGVVGLIDERKGCHRALEALRLADLPSDARLLLAGSHSPQIRELLATRYKPLVDAGRVVSRDGFLPLAELHAALAALDLSLVTHQNHIGISSIALRSAAAGRPVLGANTGWIEAIVPRFDLGWTCDVTDPANLAQAIEAALPKAATWRLGPAGAKLLAFHDVANFRACIARRLRKRLDLPDDSQRIDWSAVESAVDA
ncbi:glycosyltransferase [Pirellulimonas nuda]|nr:glycosyltransferase [Pirellulimonas nuda]